MFCLWKQLFAKTTQKVMKLDNGPNDFSPKFLTYRLEFVQTPGQKSLPSQIHLPLLPTLHQSSVSKPSGCGRQPLPPDPPAEEKSRAEEDKRHREDGRTRREELDKEGNKDRKIYSDNNAQNKKIIFLVLKV